MGGIAQPKRQGAEEWQRPLSAPMPHDDPDPNVRALNARLKRILNAAERRDWRGRLPHTLLPFAVIFCAAVWAGVAVEILSPWPMGLTARHLVSALGCNETRSLGLAPATRGQPGYWSWHDGDHDGIACEPPRPRRNHSHRT